MSEVVIHRSFLPRQHRHGRVIPHGTHRLIAGLCQGPQHLIALFETDLEHLLIDIELGAGDRSNGLTREAALNKPGVVSQPVLVGLTGLQ